MRNLESQKRKFGRACKALYELAQDGFYIYLGEDTLYLMNGESHDLDGKARQDRILTSYRIPRAGGGDW